MSPVSVTCAEPLVKVLVIILDPVLLLEASPGFGYGGWNGGEWGTLSLQCDSPLRWSIKKAFLMPVLAYCQCIIFCILL